jgi:hypothetical protein
MTTPTMMETLRDGLAMSSNASGYTVVLDENDPKAGTLAFKYKDKGREIKATAAITIKGDSTVVVQFDNFNKDMNPEVIRTAHGKLMAAFGHKELGVASPQVSGVANYNHSIETRVAPEQVEAANAKIATHKDGAAKAIKVIQQDEGMKHQGYDPKLRAAQTNHDLGQALGTAPQHNVMTGRAPDSPMMAVAREAASEMDRLLGRKPASAPAPVAHAPAPAVDPDFARLMQKEFKSTAEASTIVAKDVHPETMAKNAAGKVTDAVGKMGLVGKGAALLAAVGGSGIAAAAQAPEGQRLEAAGSAMKKASAEHLVPGITETDKCAAQGKAWGNAGAGIGAVGLTGGVAYVTGGIGLLAGAATTAVGGYAGDKIGSLLGEGVCRLAQAATSGVSSDNLAMTKHKPDAGQHAAATKVPDASPSKAHSTAAARG